MGTFNQDIIVFFKLGILSYLIDFLTAKDLYKNCKYPITNQIEILIHHILFMFSLTGWLSNNKTILIMYVVGLLLTVIHWKYSNYNCKLTENIKNDCNISNGLRSPINLLKINNIPFLKKLFYVTVIYALYKIYY